MVSEGNERGTLDESAATRNIFQEVLYRKNYNSQLFRRNEEKMTKDQLVGYCYHANMLTLSEVFDDADDQLFRRILNNKSHTLQSYLQDENKSHSQYNLPHNKILIAKITKLDSKDFLIRMPYKNCY